MSVSRSFSIGIAGLAVLLITSCTFQINYDRYAIVYGISDYPLSTTNDLNYCDDDALAMESLLIDQGYSVIRRTDATATKANLQSDIASIVSQAQPEDLFLFYFSGHGGQGSTLGGKGEKSTSDAYDEWIFLADSITDGGVVWTETVNDDELADLLAQVPTQKRVVLIDACNSGGFIGNDYEVDGIPETYTGDTDGPLAALFQAIGLYTNADSEKADIEPSLALVIGASGEREYSYEASSIGHGVFTYFLLDSPQYGDINRDGFTTVSETYLFVQKSIEQNWNIWLDPDSKFLPHVSGGPLDFILFTAK